MTLHYAIDSSIFVRMVTEEPKALADAMFDKLESLIQGGSQIWISSMAIGESYIAIQHHYGTPKTDIRDVMLDVFEKGWVIPLGGHPVLKALKTTTGPGLLDRLIGVEGQSHGLKTLTLDRKMGSLPDCERLLIVA